MQWATVSRPCSCCRDCAVKLIWQSRVFLMEIATASRIHHNQSTEGWYHLQTHRIHRAFYPPPSRLLHEPGIYLYSDRRLTILRQTALQTLIINLYRHAVGSKGCGSYRFANNHWLNDSPFGGPLSSWHLIHCAHKNHKGRIWRISVSESCRRSCFQF